LHESIQRLEEKIAFLEHHVTAQDKVMLELAEEVATLRRELKAWRERVASSVADAAGESASESERPPHY
jgi:SlyX protein